MSIQNLRDKALAYTQNQRFTYPICLEPDYQHQLDIAVVALGEARKLLSEFDTTQDDPNKPAAGRKLGDNPRQALQNTVTEHETALTELEANIPPDSLLIIQFRRLTPTEYQTMQTRHVSEKGILNIPNFYIELATTCYLTATSSTGEDTGLTWDEILNGVLSPMDLDHIYVGLVGLHQRVSRIPLGSKTFGKPDTN